MLTEDVLGLLVSQGVLSVKQFQLIRAGGYDAEKNTRLLQILAKRHEVSLSKFRTTLIDSNQSHLAELLNTAAESELESDQ